MCLFSKKGELRVGLSASYHQYPLPIKKEKAEDVKKQVSR